MTAAVLTRPGGGSSAASLFLLGAVVLAVIPLPAPIIDFFLAVSLCLALLIFMVALFVEKPLEFSSFPSLLLLVTLFRLSLGIATTRRILLHGGEGIDAAGHMIRSFGEFAVGGNYVVGTVVFLILVVVNFIVITKGAERISEVAARFTLDSMPGKQMAIDADLGAGLITEQNARERRQQIEQQADFYGTMDGASKFVRGDAIAGLLITAINVLGGIIIGVAQNGMPIADAAKTFSILSIGDGLVTQIPALIVSTGAALLTTRGSTQGDFGRSLGDQLFARPKAIMVSAAALVGLGLMPGMPHLVLFGLAATLVVLSKRRPKPDSAAEPKVEKKASRSDDLDPAAQKAQLTELLPVDLFSIRVGLDLLPLVDADRNGELLVRIASIRKQLALELGIIIPPVHVQDDLQLTSGAYEIQISGARVAAGQVRLGRLLAIDPTGSSASKLAGEACEEPAFGLPAKWIAISHRDRAEREGCTVVDPSAVVATHLTHVARQHAHELLGRTEAQELIDVAAKENEKLVEELIPTVLPFAEVLKVLRNLLREGVSIRDVRTILECLADGAGSTKNPIELTELVRQRLARQITGAHLDPKGALSAMILAPQVESAFRPSREAPNPDALSRATRAIERAAKEAAMHEDSTVLVVAPDVRRSIAEIALRHVRGLSVLSFREIDPNVPLNTRRIIGFEES
jgi:flagellar biosynthesis protein FlhA